jgi:hypothetical protein
MRGRQDRHLSGTMKPWIYPTPHLHAADGSVLCRQSDAYAVEAQKCPGGNGRSGPYRSRHPSIRQQASADSTDAPRWRPELTATMVIAATEPVDAYHYR